MKFVQTKLNREFHLFENTRRTAQHKTIGDLKFVGHNLGFIHIELFFFAFRVKFLCQFF